MLGNSRGEEVVEKRRMRMKVKASTQKLTFLMLLGAEVVVVFLLGVFFFFFCAAR